MSGNQSSSSSSDAHPSPVKNDLGEVKEGIYYAGGASKNHGKGPSSSRDVSAEKKTFGFVDANKNKEFVGLASERYDGKEKEK